MLEYEDGSSVSQPAPASVLVQRRFAVLDRKLVSLCYLISTYYNTQGGGVQMAWQPIIIFIIWTV